MATHSFILRLFHIITLANPSLCHIGVYQQEAKGVRDCMMKSKCVRDGAKVSDCLKKGDVPDECMVSSRTNGNVRVLENHLKGILRADWRGLRCWDIYPNNTQAWITWRYAHNDVPEHAHTTCATHIYTPTPPPKQKCLNIYTFIASSCLSNAQNMLTQRLRTFPAHQC